MGSRIKNNYAGVNIPFFVVCCILSGSHLVMRVIGSVSYQFSPVRVITGSSILTVVSTTAVSRPFFMLRSWNCKPKLSLDCDGLGFYTLGTYKLKVLGLIRLG